MLNSQRDTARAGHRGCRCCYPTPKHSVLRAREERMWRDDNDDEIGECDECRNDHPFLCDFHSEEADYQ